MIVRTMHRAVVFMTLALAGLVGPGALETAVELGQATDVVGFRVIHDGEATRIVIHAAGPVRYRDEFEPLPPRLTVELMGAQAMIPLKEYDDIYRDYITRFDLFMRGVTMWISRIFPTDNNCFKSRICRPSDFHGIFCFSLSLKFCLQFVNGFLCSSKSFGSNNRCFLQ